MNKQEYKEIRNGFLSLIGILSVLYILGIIFC